MREARSASQILFGHLPEQTVDIKGGIWKVIEWPEARPLTDLDEESLRKELIRLASAWRVSGKDGGYVDELERGYSVRVLSLNRDIGAHLGQFPRQWICKACRRIHTDARAKCKCGSTLKGQMHFVGYCDACGSIEQPRIPRCETHKEARITFPGTAKATEIRFDCPTCNKLLREGFGFIRCPSCGEGNLTFNVHRSSAVYSPRTVVIVNPPSKPKIRRITEAGGPPKALHWVLEGMPGRDVGHVGTTRESIRQAMAAQGFSEAMIQAAIRAALESGELQESEPVEFPSGGKDAAEQQAITIALAASSGRRTIQDLVSAAAGRGALERLYGERYAAGLAAAGLETVDFIDSFPVLTGQFGYTRGDGDPGVSRLRTFSDRKGHVVYGDLAETEALFFRLSPSKVARWLEARGHALGRWGTDREARLAILRQVTIPETGTPRTQASTGMDLMTMIHSYAHRAIRLGAVFAGIERNALSEMVVPLHLGFFMYAAARGDFVLGGLQAVFEGELDGLLGEIARGEHRCALDPGCSKAGGACAACLHLGEPSCRYFNRFLDRRSLFGRDGYFPFTDHKSGFSRAI